MSQTPSILDSRKAYILYFLSLKAYEFDRYHLVVVFLLRSASRTNKVYRYKGELRLCKLLKSDYRDSFTKDAVQPGAYFRYSYIKIHLRLFQKNEKREKLTTLHRKIFLY